MTELALIVAIAENRAIGLDGVMPWHIPADLKYFKKITTGYPVIMGRVTFEGLPFGPLPNRTNIVLTSKPNIESEGYVEVDSIEKALQLCKDEEKVFIMGGASIYKQALELPELDTLYITWIHNSFEADTFFPEFDLGSWQMTACERHEADDKNTDAYSFCTYKRTANPKKQSFNC